MRRREDGARLRTGLAPSPRPAWGAACALLGTLQACVRRSTHRTSSGGRGELAATASHGVREVRLKRRRGTLARWLLARAP